jgi:hypothetical protein
MGVTGVQALRIQIQNLAAAESEFEGMINKEMKIIAPAVTDSMHFNSDVMKNRISGDMVRAMKTRVEGMRMRFGFIDGYQPNGRDDSGLYMKLQTVTGFTHRGGQWIAPSLALKESQEDAKLLMNEASRRIRKNFMQRLRRRR